MLLLCGDDVNRALKPVINADEFAENILGFEEVDEDEEEGLVEVEEMGDPNMQETKGMGVIPEEAGYWEKWIKTFINLKINVKWINLFRKKGN